MDILLLVVIAYLGFRVGIWYAHYLLRRQFSQLVQRVMAAKFPDEQTTVTKEPEQIGDEKIIQTANALPVYEIEKHGELLYLWDTGKSRFLCQGATLEELALNLKSIVSPEPAMVMQGTVKWVFDDGKLYTTSE
tara:strand:+ start:618 stop:1019 length:402 start_codon:yes stop_codon:yes gene_type:complete